MRRMALALLLFFLSSCSTGYPPTISDAPGGIRGRTPARQAINKPQGCHEVHRTKCAVDDCKGANMDYVTIRCEGRREINRCVINIKCG